MTEASVDELARESPVAWFAALECAREEHDYHRAAYALRQLDRLGVQVKFRKRPKSARGES